MRASYRGMVVAIGVTLLAFAVHYVPSFAMGISSSDSLASKHLWDATTWGFDYKVAATVASIVCVAVRYVSKVPRISSK